MMKHVAAQAQCQGDSHEMGPLAMISAFMASAEGRPVGQPCAHGRGELPRPAAPDNAFDAGGRHGNPREMFCCISHCGSFCMHAGPAFPGVAHLRQRHGHAR